MIKYRSIPLPGRMRGTVQQQHYSGDERTLGYKDSDPTVGWFVLGGAIEAGTGAGIVALGPLGYAFQLVSSGFMPE
jgi:hypothetical protein